MRICVFEDRKVEQLAPLSLTRPTFDLICGRNSLHDKQIRQFPTSQQGAFVRPHLAEVCAALRPEMVVNEGDWVRAGPMVLVNSRWLPGATAPAGLPERCVGMCAGEAAFAVVGPEQTEELQGKSLDACLAGWASALPQVPASGRMVHHLWDLVQWNGEQIVADFDAMSLSSACEGSAPAVPPHLYVVGLRELVYVDPSARLDPLVVADTTAGPVIVEHGAYVAAFSHLEGPCVIGAGTHVLGARIRHGTTLGPQCRIGGEIEASIVQGYSNKCHDGFLGHAYLGEWVNLGAGTCNSDLRNDYAPVTVIVEGTSTLTGLRKVGCFIGDHTKTGLGMVLNTGTNIGAFCNLLPSGHFPAKYLPSFSNWWNGKLADNVSVERALDTAAIVMRRRQRSLTPALAALYRQLYHETAAQRARAVREGDKRRLRLSA